MQTIYYLDKIILKNQEIYSDASCAKQYSCRQDEQGLKVVGEADFLTFQLKIGINTT